MEIVLIVNNTYKLNINLGLNWIYIVRKHFFLQKIRVAIRHSISIPYFVLPTLTIHHTNHNRLYNAARCCRILSKLIDLTLSVVSSRHLNTLLYNIYTSYKSITYITVLQSEDSLSYLYIIFILYNIYDETNAGAV